YDTFEEDLEDALLQLHDGQIPYLNIPQTVPDHCSQSETKPKVFVVKKEIEESQSDYSEEGYNLHQDVKPVVKLVEQVPMQDAKHGDTQSSTSDSEEEDNHSNNSEDTGGGPQLPIEPQVVIREGQEGVKF
ncbi:unnamed protein product, partial [Meganyctiphanes norvegica]